MGKGLLLLRWPCWTAEVPPGIPAAPLFPQGDVYLHRGILCGPVFFFFAQNAGNYFPEQGWNLSPLHWKWKVLNNGSPGNSPWVVLNKADKISFKNCSKGLWVFCLFLLFIYFWLCWVFVAAHGLSLVVVQGLLIAVASLVAEHRL